MLIAPDGAIGHAEVRLGDSVIMVSECTGRRIQTYAIWDSFVCGRLRLDKVFVRTLHSLKLAA
jgi:hypothetical protein